MQLVLKEFRDQREFKDNVAPQVALDQQDLPGAQDQMVQVEVLGNQDLQAQLDLRAHKVLRGLLAYKETGDRLVPRVIGDPLDHRDQMDHQGSRDPWDRTVTQVSQGHRGLQGPQETEANKEWQAQPVMWGWLDRQVRLELLDQLVLLEWLAQEVHLGTPERQEILEILDPQDNPVNLGQLGQQVEQGHRGGQDLLDLKDLQALGVSQASPGALVYQAELVK